MNTSYVYPLQHTLHPGYVDTCILSCQLPFLYIAPFFMTSIYLASSSSCVPAVLLYQLS
jgi:hypothetical protein